MKPKLIISDSIANNKFLFSQQAHGRWYDSQISEACDSLSELGR